MSIVADRSARGMSAFHISWVTSVTSEWPAANRCASVGSVANRALQLKPIRSIPSSPVAARRVAATAPSISSSTRRAR